MQLKSRISVAAAVSVAVVLIASAMACYLVVRHELLMQVDESLRAQKTAISQGDVRSLTDRLPSIPASAGGPAPYVEAFSSVGDVVSEGDLNLPFVPHTLTPNQTGMSDAQVGASHLRVLAFALPFYVTINGQPTQAVLELARPLNGVDRILTDLRLVLATLVLGAVALVTILSRLSARRVLAPLAEVARAADHITTTEDLDTRIPVTSQDEVGDLAKRFNTMIVRLGRSRTALDQSVAAQRQLIADASHELRTPITSLRTNLEVLSLHDAPRPPEEDEIFADMVEQTEELTTLISDLIELARSDAVSLAIEDVRLDTLVDSCVARAQRDFPERAFKTQFDPVVVEGDRDRLTRAIDNLIRNAAVHSESNAPIEIAAGAEGVIVRDHGRGIDQADLPHVFERFYRGVHSRGRQGSGLGLAIVQQVARQHAAEAIAENAPDGGAVFRIQFQQTWTPSLDARF